MNRVSKLYKLAPEKRRLLIEAMLLLAFVWVTLRLLRFATLRRLLASMVGKRVSMKELDPAYADRVAWAVSVGSRYVRGANCLAQALATQTLLGRRGYQPCIQFGVTRGDDRQIEAHAWVECDGLIVSGGPESELVRYSPLGALDKASP